MPPRPGTKHAKQLYEYLTSTTNSLSNKYTILQTHLDKYHEAVGAKSKKKNGGDKEFIEEDKWINNDMSSEVKARGYLTRDELIRLMNWKLHHGKFRGTLKGNIKKNTAASVEKISKNTIALMSKAAADTTCISDQLKKDAVKQFSKLISVGPATASAFLSEILLIFTGSFNNADSPLPKACFLVAFAIYGFFFISSFAKFK